ncbi:MAG: heme ABC exporter ATP-binding protein CcmA [Chloroflexota bacterium]|nr:heme ABC exporter ATP-binding protein CcmA [Chloroflexota bacterium]
MIVARGITKTFGRVAALRQVDLTVQAGERVAVLGPNGAGKSTLLRVLGTLVRPTAGTLNLAGHNALTEGHAVRAAIGMVGHQPFLYDDLTLAENLRFYGRLYGVSELEGRIDEVLELVGLAARAQERARILSRGQQQRLAIGRAILADPAVLLLDEPDTGLDVEGRRLLDRLLAPNGRTVVFSTHDRSWAEQTATRSVLLDRGRLVEGEPTGIGAE